MSQMSRVVTVGTLEHPKERIWIVSLAGKGWDKLVGHTMHRHSSIVIHQLDLELDGRNLFCG
jgi:hypothetical protein